MREKAAMRQLVADFKSEGLTEAEVVRAAALFKRHDATHRGALSPRSFSSLMVKAGAADGIEYTEAELQGLLRRADLDADGDIDFYELTELLSRQKRLRKHVEEKELIQKRKAEVDARNAAKYAAEATEKAKIEAAEKRNKERRRRWIGRSRRRRRTRRCRLLLQSWRHRRASEHQEQRQAWEAGGTMDDKEGYRQMIREEVDASGVLGEMPHMTPEMEEMIIAFYVKFDTRAQVTDLHCRCHLLHLRHLTHHIHLPQGKLSKADFVEGMRAYGKAAGNEKAYKTQLLELAFEAADTDAQNELSLAHFLRYVGRGGRLNVLPRAFAEAADYDLRGKLHHKKASQEEIDEAARARDDDGRRTAARVSGDAVVGGRRRRQPIRRDPAAVRRTRRRLLRAAAYGRGRAGPHGFRRTREQPHRHDCSHIQQVNLMIAFFKKFDNDCDTELTPPDFVKGFQSYAAQIGQEKAYTAKMLKAAYKAAHTSGDGGLSFPEFLRFVGRNGRINIDPFALAKVADFTLPPGETYGVKPPEALAAEMAQQAHQDARAQRIAAMKAQREAMQKAGALPADVAADDDHGARGASHGGRRQSISSTDWIRKNMGDTIEHEYQDDMKALRRSSCDHARESVAMPDELPNAGKGGGGGGGAMGGMGGLFSKVAATKHTKAKGVAAFKGGGGGGGGFMGKMMGGMLEMAAKADDIVEGHGHDHTGLHDYGVDNVNKPAAPHKPPPGKRVLHAEDLAPPPQPKPAGRRRSTARRRSSTLRRRRASSRRRPRRTPTTGHGRARRRGRWARRREERRRRAAAR